MIDDVDEKLHRWARWAMSGRPLLGISDRTVLYAMIKSGVTTKGTGLRPEPDAEEEEVTESGLQWLRSVDAQQHEVVVMHYLGRGTTKQKSKDLHLSENTYFKHLRLGRYRLEAFFDARMALT